MPAKHLGWLVDGMLDLHSHATTSLATLDNLEWLVVDLERSAGGNSRQKDRTDYHHLVQRDYSHFAQTNNLFLFGLWINANRAQRRADTQ
jgi:hypothetical protein